MHAAVVPVQSGTKPVERLVATEATSIPIMAQATLEPGSSLVLTVFLDGVPAAAKCRHVRGGADKWLAAACMTFAL